VIAAYLKRMWLCRKRNRKEKKPMNIKMILLACLLALTAAEASARAFADEDAPNQGQHNFPDTEVAKTSIDWGNINLYGAITLSSRFATPPVKRVENVPFGLRNVEIHDDDPWGVPGVIEDDDSRAPWMSEWDLFRAGFEMDLDGREDRVLHGYLCYFWNYGHWLTFGGEDNKRNYTNAPGTDKRGYGAALTEWEVTYSRWIPGIGLELQFRDEDASYSDNHTHWCLGAMYRRYELQIVGGYDRYNKGEHHHHEDIGTIHEESVYLGWTERDDDSYSHVRVGMTFHQYESRGRYRGVGVDVNDFGFFVSFAMGWKF
jgi:hypothetical protein